MINNITPSTRILCLEYSDFYNVFYFSEKRVSEIPAPIIELYIQLDGFYIFRMGRLAEKYTQLQSLIIRTHGNDVFIGNYDGQHISATLKQAIHLRFFDILIGHPKYEQ